MNPYDFLKNLGLVLGVAAVTSVVFQKLRQPVVLGYILAGLIVGPHVPVPLVADQATIRTLSELGVILLMFSLGLDFRLRKLVKVGASSALIAVIEVSLMMWLGFGVAQLFGWSVRASVFVGGIVAISSTTIIAKVLEEQKAEPKLREIAFGVLIFEDIAAILLLSSLSALGAGRGLGATALVMTSFRLLAFLVGSLVVGMLVIPRLMRAVVRIGRPETTLIVSVGICFLLALLAHAFGYSVALGAFLAGAVVAESGESKRIFPLVQPVRDIFVAIFFVAVGMSINPAPVMQHWGALVALFFVVAGGKVVSVTLGTFLAGHGARVAIQTGMSLAQIGEFSFIIAAIGARHGSANDFIYPLAVVVSAMTTLTTPWLIRASGPVASFVDRKLPP